MPKYRLVLDLATNRVIHFTADESLPLYTDESSVLVDHFGDVPPDMVPYNTWKYTYISQQFKDTSASTTPQPTLLEKNRVSISQAINNRINDLLKATQEQNLGVRFYEECVVVEAKRCLANEEDSYPWLEVFMVSQGLTSLTHAAHLAMTKYDGNKLRVLHLQKMRNELLQDIKQATTNDRLFVLRDKLFKVM